MAFHQNRLPINEPNVRRRAREFARRRELARNPGQEPDGLDPANRSPQTQDPSGAQAQAVVRSTPTVSDTPSILKRDQRGLPVVQAVEQQIRIQVEQTDDRPFELADLFTRKWIDRNSGFLVSFAFHLALFLAFSLFLIHGTGKALIVLTMMTSPAIDERTGADVQFDLNANSMEELFDADADSVDMLGSIAGDDLPKLAEVGEIAADSGNGSGAKGGGDGKSAEFFGTRAIGNSFVYVLDSSGSMGTQNSKILASGKRDPITRFEVAKNELLASVESLQPHQEFYVVLFSTQTRRMFDDGSLIPKSYKATTENKLKLRNWLKTTAVFGGTDPRKSVQIGLKMKPDAMFILSDGEFSSATSPELPETKEIVRQHVEKERVPVKINSIAFEDEMSKRNMLELSRASGGDFKFVKIADYRKRLLESPDEMTRLVALEFYATQSTLTFQERQGYATKTLIPLLKSESDETRRTAERLLNMLSFHIFEQQVAKVDEIGQRDEATADWKQIWEKSSDTEVGRDGGSDFDLGFFRELASGTMAENFDSLTKSQVDEMNSMQLISTARQILAFQSIAVGEEFASVETPTRIKDTSPILLEVLWKLNEPADLKFSRTGFLNSPSFIKNNNRFERILKNRSKVAARLYKKWKNVRYSEQQKEVAYQELVVTFPETKLAKQAMRENRGKTTVNSPAQSATSN